MTPREQISKLQGLLERVRMRAGASRAEVRAALPAYGTAEYASPGHAVTPSPPGAEVDELLTASAVHPSTRPSTRPSVQPTGDEDDMDSAEVEVSSETVEIDIDIDEPVAMESGAQPVAHPTMPPEDLEEVDEQRKATRPPGAPPEELEEIHATRANEIEEPTPSSSRRPIAGEEVQPEAYEGESAPRHTPPPESGKQVAAPSVSPPSRKPSVPPPSADDRTLIGGWREPGLGGPPVVAGAIRPEAAAASSSSRADAGAVVGVPRPGGAAQVSSPRLTADVTRPDLAPGNVATFAGAVPPSRPATLGDLLDMTLGL